MYALTEDMLYFYTAKKTADFMLKKFLTPYGFGSSFNADSEIMVELMRRVFIIKSMTI